MSPFMLSIEPVEGKSFTHGFHLGTDERVARDIAKEAWHARNKQNLPTVTVALMRDGKIFDCYMGDRWQNE